MPLKVVTYCAEQLGISPQAVRRICASAHHRYKHFRIPKRRIGEFRDVAQPAREVKAVQESIVELFKSRLPIHACATAYKPGASIIHNAQTHANAKFLLKLDFENFFGSLTSKDIQRLISTVDGISESEVLLVANAVSWFGIGGVRSLCIGAPSSPFFSNALMYAFDSKMDSECRESGAVYTRYSDDIAITGQERGCILRIENKAREFLKSLEYPTLTFRQDKRVLISAAHHLQITGITLTTRGTISIGRERKRGIRAGIRKYCSGKLNPDEILSLKGEIAFARGVEKDFLDLLVKWEGREAVNGLLSHSS